MTYDVAVVGTGPSGVSAAWPLVRAGLRVLLVDASAGRAITPPSGDYLDLRRNDPRQADWMIGRDFTQWLATSATSPKLRVPTMRPVFEDFCDSNRIETQNFVAVGSLAAGGLSNAWGCGVARYDAEDLRAFPVSANELTASFAAVASRIGISGHSEDAMRDYFGLDDWAAEAPPLGGQAERLWQHFRAKQNSAALAGIQLGRARLALLSESRGNRLGCDLSGLCLWGCARGALYSARQELPQLVKAGAEYRGGVVVDHLEQDGSTWKIRGRERQLGTSVSITAHRVVLAAGTLATTAIAWRTLRQFEAPRPLLSNPTSAFLLLRPSAIGQAPKKGASFAELAFSIRLPSENEQIYGGIFSTVRLPSSEFIRHIPLSRNAARSLWRLLVPATLVGNAFLPSRLNTHRAVLKVDGTLRIEGSQSSELPSVVLELAAKWRRAAQKMGAIILPGSFQIGALGSDIHYAGTLPMKQEPARGETTCLGELKGARGVFIADASIFPALSPKPHTLTMMALADRVGTKLACSPADPRRVRSH